MSRDSLEGINDLIDIEPATKHYEEGNWQPYRAEVDTLVELFLDRTLAHWGGEYPRTDARRKRHCHERDEILRTESAQPMLRKRADKVAEILPEDADPSAFIDCLLFAIHRSEYEGPDYCGYGADHRQSFLNDLLDPVVQVFYDRGHNDFLIDLSFLIFEPEKLAVGLIGREDEPLRVTYRGNVDNFANFVSDCDLTLDGKVSGNFVGGSGGGNFRSKIAFDYDNAYKLCIGSYQTEFYLEVMPWLSDHIGSICTSEECAFYVRRKPCYERMAILKEESFFGRYNMYPKRRRKGNRLYHRQGRGWTKVTP